MGVLKELRVIVLGPEGVKLTLLVKLRLLDKHVVAEPLLIEDPVT